MNAILKRMDEHKRASIEAAQKLTTIGMGVRVLKDDGSEVLTTLKSLPWPLGHGVMIAKVEGISGGYDCSRITPAVESEAAS